MPQPLRRRFYFAAGLIDQLLFKFIGADAYFFFKEPRKIRQVFESKGISYFGDILLVVLEAVFGSTNQVNVDEFDGRFTGFLLE